MGGREGIRSGMNGIYVRMWRRAKPRPFILPPFEDQRKKSKGSGIDGVFMGSAESDGEGGWGCATVDFPH